MRMSMTIGITTRITATITTTRLGHFQNFLKQIQPFSMKLSRLKVEGWIYRTSNLFDFLKLSLRRRRKLNSKMSKSISLRLMTEMEMARKSEQKRSFVQGTLEIVRKKSNYSSLNSWNSAKSKIKFSNVESTLSRWILKTERKQRRKLNSKMSNPSRYVW